MDYDTRSFCSMIRPEITADFIGYENLCLVNSTLYERSTRPMKLCVPLFTPPDHAAVCLHRRDRGAHRFSGVHPGGLHTRGSVYVDQKGVTMSVAIGYAPGAFGQ